MFKRHQTTLILGLTQTLAWGTTYYLPAILAEPMAGELNLGTEWIFGAFSAALIVAAVAAPPVGRWIDHHGGRDVLAGSNLVIAAGLALLAWADGAAVMSAAWLIIGAGMAMGLYEAAFATLTGIHGTKARGAMTGITLLGGLASTVFWPLTAYLDAELGWRAACLVWAGVHVVVGFPLNRLGLGHATQPTAPAEPTQASARWSATMVLLAVAFTAIWCVSTAIAAHLPRLLTESGLSAPAAIAAAALVGPSQVAGRLLEFSAMRHVSPLLSARLAAMAHPAGAFCLMVFGGPAATLFAVLHGAGNGILTVAKGTLPLALFGASGYGHRQGLVTVPARIGQATAPFVFAVLIERWGPSALVVSAGIGLVSSGALLVIRPTRPVG
ncbi:MAG: MFS transporter [Ectothiorhodospiraceae bacterium]